jgi:hypothetical protein
MIGPGMERAERGSEVPVTEIADLLAASDGRLRDAIERVTEGEAAAVLNPVANEFEPYINARNRMVKAVAQSRLGTIEALRGNFRRARGLLNQARKNFIQSGQLKEARTAKRWLAYIEERLPEISPVETQSVYELTDYRDRRQTSRYFHY